jgi:hypothetical protein
MAIAGLQGISPTCYDGQKLRRTRNVPSTAELLYWIVQPLTEGFQTDGFRKFFHNPSMGRAEFNSPGMDLKKLYEKSGGTPVIEAYKITVPPTSRPVYFVGRGADLASHGRAMELWLRSGGETKVPCWFAECFHGPTPQITVPTFVSPLIAWWAMRGGFMFTLDPTVAGNLLKAIHLEATTHASFWGEWN